MAKIKINDTEYDSVCEQVLKAQEYIYSVEDSWGKNFDNLYNNFITSGFLEALYKDAESQYYTLANAGHFVAATASGAGLGAAIGSVVPGVGTAVGAVVGGVIGAIAGVVGWVQNPTEIKWSYESKKVFEQLLVDCVNGDEPNYTKISNLMTKIDNVQASLFEIRTKINEYNHLYADLSAAANSLNLSTNLASDGITVLSVDTEVTIDGKTVKTTVSDAMNAFYTYTTTVMSAEMEASYIAEKYGVNINYEDIVSNANAFMSKTIKSDLYSHEFVDAILPSYNPSYNKAVNTVAGDLGLESSEVKSILKNHKQVAGNLSKYAGLLGASFIGKITKDTEKYSNPVNPIPPDPLPPSGGTVVPPEDDDPEVTDKKKKKKIEGELQSGIINEAIAQEIVQVTEDNLPEQVGIDQEKDYDALAREQFEAQGDVLITERRSEVAGLANELFVAEDKTELKNLLQSYGYNESDIETIIVDRDLVVNAIIDGDQREQLTEIAQSLAAEDGIENFDTAYDNDYSYTNLIDGTSEQLLTNMSTDESIINARNELRVIEEEYNQSVIETNEALAQVNESKTNLESIKEEINNNIASDTNNWSDTQRNAYEAELDKVTEDFVEKYGDSTKWNSSEIDSYLQTKESIKQSYVEKIQGDPSTWTNEQLDKYNRAADEYNHTVENATELYEKNTELANEYKLSVDNYDNVKSDFFSRIKTQYTENISATVNPIEDVSTSVETDINITNEQLMDIVDVSGSGATL